MDPNPDSKISSGQGAYVPPARFYGTSVEKRKAAELEKPTVKPTPGVMQNKCSTFLPFTSSHKNRIQARTDMYREVTGRIAGPFEFGRFIATFLEPPPPARLPCPWTDEKNGPKFSIVASAPTELQMYDPWIDAMKEFCPRLKIINTSKHAAKTFLDLEIKPDMSKAEIIMEFKHSKNDDPFEEDDKCEQKAFEKTTDLARDTLGQITLYTTAQLASQFRTHAFSVLVFPTYSRLLHWARDGVAVTAKISSKDLAEFFWQFNHSSPAIRGRDTSVSNKLGESLNGSIEESKVWKILKLDEYTPLVRVSLGENNGDYIVGSPTYMAASSPIGRATRSFKALSVATGEPVFLKDSWRIDAKHHKPEHEIYEKLRKAKVPHVATLIEASDILLHKTKLAQLPEGKKLRLRTFIHYRIVLKEIGIDLCSFVNTKELVQVLRDATEAHYHAFKFANVLHGDISAGNIVITPSGRGLLIDWDLCRDLDDINHQQARWEQTGTWQFMAARLLRVASVSGRKLPQPNRTDDHESFLWVLLWVALKHTKHQLPGLPLKNKLYSIFDESHWDVGGVSTGGGGKLAFCGGTNRN